MKNLPNKGRRKPVMLKSLFYGLGALAALGAASCTNGKPEAGDTQESAKLFFGPADCEWLGSDTLGTELRMNMIQKAYPRTAEYAYAIVLNPQRLQLMGGYDWKLLQWESGRWVVPKMKGNYGILDVGFIPITTPDYYCFRFPIGRYEVTRGKYRITKSFHNERTGEEQEVSAEFWIE